MDIHFQAQAKNADGEAAAWRADAVIVPVFKDEEALSFIPVLAEAAPWLSISPALRDFTGAKNDSAFLYGHPDLPISRALFVGLGNRSDFSAKILRDAVAGAVKELARRKIQHLAFAVESLRVIAGDSEHAVKLVEEVVLGAKLAVYDFAEYKSKKENSFTPRVFSLLFSEDFVQDAEQIAARKAEAIAGGIYYARNIINGPGNVVTPEYMEEKAAALAAAYNFNFKSHGPEFLEDQGMGAFMAVAQGSAKEPRLLILEHAPKGTENDQPVIIVGKGITFDSGGISLKPSAGMEKMKRDMAGAGTVLGLFAAIGASANVKQRVIGIMPCCENMPDGNAVKPGDIVKTLSGKTVEITNTDAEGRLLLCDCLTMAQNMATPLALIDIATLTGACVVALGDKTCGLFTNNDELGRNVLAVAAEAGERFWPLPVYDEDIEGLTSGTAADLNNTGPREGGALFAALFLKQFVKNETPWAHFDIAGPAYTQKAEPTNSGGATAFGLRTLFELIAKP
ncbi:leucyl aminopeptidase [Desulfovibrio sp. OttesenSCG-928-F07]|nr:leucyl aminopeptidase [Desulfovibrio sp. OttesenSCG-928-F07]